MNKDEILSEIKEALFPILVRDQMLLLTPSFLNDLFREELEKLSLDNISAVGSNYVLDKRAFNTLDYCNVKTMGDLYESTLIENLRFKGCGRKTAYKIEGFKNFFRDSCGRPDRPWDKDENWESISGEPYVTLDTRDYVSKYLYDELVSIADQQSGLIEALKNHQELLEKTLEEQGKKNKKLMDRYSLFEKFLGEKENQK
tara:strand:+ start:134 stop:733 length:600 start_codon:yes stop_codon:yes gene_type:complete